MQMWEITREEKSNMNKRNRLKTIRPQNEKAARAFRKKQNMKVELNKKWLPVIYVVMLGICILLNATSDSLDFANVLISICMFAIVGAIFIYAYRHLKHIDQMGEDFRIAISYIKGDYAKEKKLLWELYRTETRYGIFNEEHLRNAYVDYVEEMKRLEQDEEGKYACDIEDFINYELIDNAVEKGRLSLVPGAMTGLGILGTFIGLSIGLQAFNTGSAEEITNSIGPLMDGIKVAFHTSIYGMIFSLTFNLIFKTVLEQAYHKLDKFVSEFKRYVRPDAAYDNGNLELDYQKKQVEAMIAAQKSLEETLIPCLKAICENMEDIRTLTKDQNDIFRGRLNTSRMIGQNNGEDKA